MINIKFDDQKVKDDEVVTLSNAIIKIVQDATKIPEVLYMQTVRALKSESHL